MLIRIRREDITRLDNEIVHNCVQRWKHYEWTWEQALMTAVRELVDETEQSHRLLKILASFDWDTLFAAAGGVPYSPQYECDWGEFIEQVNAMVSGEKA